MSKYRYPGPKPFTDKDKDLFFGREKEREILINLIKTKGLSILFGRSGNGKSSLIHAGLIPYFEAEQYKIVEIRLQPFKSYESEQFLLKNQIITELKKNQDSDKIYLNEILPENNESSLWQYFKTLQWDANKKGFEGIIFIIDQFEELFNFPADQYKQFAKEFSEVIYNRIPYKFQETLNEKIKSESSFISENKYKIDFLRGELFSSFLIGIRSDRLYLLDELGDVIPIIFNNRFRLDHLDSTKIDEAITKPAGLKGDFLSPPFEIAPEVINEIKKYLFEDNAATQMGYIETFQLQIICEFIEHKAMEVEPAEGKIVITKNMLSKQVSDIIKEYYENIIKNIDTDSASDVQSLFIRFLIEKKLIDIKTNSRICLDKTSIYPLGINDKLLAKLIDSKIIRKEINTVSGESFEISHDSLVKPILEAAKSKVLGNLESQLYNYYSNNIKNLDDRAKRDYKHILLSKLLDKEGNLSAFKIKDVSQQERSVESKPNEYMEAGETIFESFNESTESIEILEASDKLKASIDLFEKWNIIEKVRGNKKNKDFYIINEAFRDAIIKKQNIDNLKKQKIINSGIVALCIILAFFIGLHLINRRQHKIDYAKIYLFSHTSFFGPPTDNKADTVRSVRKLILLSELYKIIKPADPASELIVKNVFTTFFNSYDFLGKRISVHNLYPYSLKRNSRNQLLVFYKSAKDISQNSPMSAYLYDQKGNSLDVYKNIRDAAFAGVSELVVLLNDSLIIRTDKEVKKVKLKPGNINLKNALIHIDSIKGDNIFLQVRLIAKSINNKSYRPMPHSIFNAKIGYDGNISEVKPQLPYMTNYSNAYASINELNQKGITKFFKHFTLSYSYLGHILSLKSDSDRSKSVSLVYPVLDASFSSSGDTIFVRDGQYLNIFDKSLKIHSKYRNSSANYGELKSASPSIAYIQPGYVVLVNFQDPVIKSVNTIDPNDIIKYIDKKKSIKPWQPLSAAEKKNFGYDNP
ncbi:hypothetical protein [Mucilaginibacter sp.]|uniref:nSTAND1 domain-containing NTPase n=1 Tax=Mucilaginibacter sp. TaxID=1882438 RepID=UPI002611FA03|nr:hypothetical protein [Mucilaginibacter sp.]MDB4921826.1 hypothetical protein [Mucilaginibacter sp.]